MNKRGLSQVVTTVLIILIVLAAVVILWSFISPLLRDSGEKIASGGDCLRLDLEIVSCKNIPGTLGGSDKVEVQVLRGPGNSELEQIRLVLDGESFDQSVVPGELETTTYTINDKTASEADVGGILVSGLICESLSEPVSCS